MDDMQAQLEELKRLLDNQKVEIKRLKDSALDPSGVAELREAARRAEVQQSYRATAQRISKTGHDAEGCTV